MKKLNIEFAHQYADKPWSQEQALALKAFRKLTKPASFTAAILIDDYNVKNSANFDVNSFLKNLDGITVDYIVFESKLISLAEELIASFPSAQLKTETFFSTDEVTLFLINKGTKIGLKKTHLGTKHVKYSCATLTCIWNLCRLGILAFPQDSFIKLTNASLTADSVLSILPAKYQSNEQRVLAILAQTQYQHLLPKITHHFFEETDNESL